MTPVRTELLMERLNHISISKPVIAAALYKKPDKIVLIINKNKGKTVIDLSIADSIPGTTIEMIAPAVFMHVPSDVGQVQISRGCKQLCVNTIFKKTL
jgi:hypothetical protein